MSKFEFGILGERSKTGDVDGTQIRDENNDSVFIYWDEFEHLIHHNDLTDEQSDYLISESDRFEWNWQEFLTFLRDNKLMLIKYKLGALDE